MTGTHAPVDVRLFRRLQLDVETGCWNWTGGTSEWGYGQLKTPNGVGYVHCLSYERLVGPIPEGHEVDHLCRNPRCANPAHLEPVTHAVNGLRGVGQGAVNVRKFACPKGHPYDILLVRGNGRRTRRCRQCENARRRAHYQRERVQ